MCVKIRRGINELIFVQAIEIPTKSRGGSQSKVTLYRNEWWYYSYTFLPYSNLLRALHYIRRQLVVKCSATERFRRIVIFR